MTTQTDQEKRDALAWLNETGPASQDQSTWDWLWESIQGDFNDNRTTGQIAFDTGVSMIPVIDQICDVRDLIANCKKINQDRDDTWAWVALCLTLIGLFPSIGSLVKGVLKIFFVFVRRMGLDQLIKAVDAGMTWVITLLRKREVQRYINLKESDEVFKWLANGVREIYARVNTQALLNAFDTGIRTLESLSKKAQWVPSLGARIKATLEQVKSVRQVADQHIAKAVEPVQKILDRIIWRLDFEQTLQRTAVVNANNVHFRGSLPEANAVSLLRRQKEKPAWLSKGPGKWKPQKMKKGKALLAKYPTHPTLSEKAIKSFHRMEADEITGPAKLYRIIAPDSRAMGESWVSEDVFLQLKKEPDPRGAWRKYLAVWPHWNVNGQFAVYEVKAGETLKVWRGPAASQVMDKGQLDGHHLEGGWEQVVFTIGDKDARNDTMRYYLRGGNSGQKLHPPGLSRQEYKDTISDAKKPAYTQVREQINHPNIRGPFETGWGYTDFDEQVLNAKIGLPELPGQITNR